METKFYVGQRVVSPIHGMGIIDSIDDDGEYPINVQFNSHSWGENSIMLSYTVDGRYWRCTPITLFPADQTKTIPTESQKKEIGKLFKDVYALGKNNEPCAIAPRVYEVESILSKPEPPKYEPKQGEAVLVKARESDCWQAEVSKGDGMQVYGCFDIFKFIRPFDASLVGKITND